MSFISDRRRPHFPTCKSRRECACSITSTISRTLPVRTFWLKSSVTRTAECFSAVTTARVISASCGFPNSNGVILSRKLMVVNCRISAANSAAHPTEPIAMLESKLRSAMPTPHKLVSTADSRTVFSRSLVSPRLFPSKLTDESVP